MKLKGKKIAVLAEKFYEDQELWYPVLRFREEGATVSVIAPKTDVTYESKHGYPVKADIASKSAKASDYDAVIIPGGYAPDHMRRDPAMVSFVADAHKQGKLVAAICHAGWMLASAGVARGKTVTGFSSIKDDLVNAGAKWEDREVVVDGNVVTSRTPADLPAFCRAIIDALARTPVNA
jgi:protease I